MNVLNHGIDYMNTQLLSLKLLEISLPPMIVHFIYDGHFANLNFVYFFFLYNNTNFQITIYILNHLETF